MKIIFKLLGVLLFCLSCTKNLQNDITSVLIMDDLSVPNHLKITDSTNKIIDFSPALSADQMELYFVVSDSLFQKYEIKKYDCFDGSVENLPFSADLKDYSPFITIDNECMFFASFRISNNTKDLQDNPDIWFVKRSSNGWGIPIKLDDDINSEFGEGFISVAANGNLYFESNRPGGYGDWDIYMAEKSGDGYLAPENLGVGINTELNESDPFIAPDESYIIYGSYNREDSYGSSDLYISFKEKEGDFGAAINLGNIINTQYLEHNPHVTSDGKYFFFSTDKPLEDPDVYKMANFDIYYMSADFIVELKSKGLD